MQSTQQMFFFPFSHDLVEHDARDVRVHFVDTIVVTSEKKRHRLLLTRQMHRARAR